jgi:hypothetical protein
VLAALTGQRAQFNNQGNTVAIRREVPLMNLWTPVNLVSANCPVSNCKHHAASVYRQLGLSTPAKAVRNFSPQPFQQVPPDRTYRASASKFTHTLYEIVMRIPPWTQVLRCV